MEDNNYETQELNIDNFQKVELMDIDKTSSTYIYKLDTEEYLLSNIFKIISPTSDAPFMSWNNIHKVARGFETTDDINSWLIQTDNVIMIKYKRLLHSSDSDKYELFWGTAAIQQTKVGVIIATQHEITRNSKNILDIISILQKAVNIDLIEGLERDIVCQFDIPSQTFNQIVLLELITNDELIMKYLSIDESLQTKKSFLTVRYHPITLKSFGFTITEQYSETEGEYYTRIKIKGSQSQSIIDNFRDIISRVCTYYNEKESEIIDIYKSLDIKMPKPKNKNIKKTKNFLKGQSRKCQDQPDAFITEEEALDSLSDEYKKTEGSILKFPKDGDDREGYEQRYYTCNYPGKPWPGLTKTKTEGDIGVMCCFKKKQLGGKINSPWENYISGETSVKTTRTLHILGPNKVLVRNQQGKLTDKLNMMFASSIESGEIMLRNGLDSTPKSFLYCVSAAVNKPIILEDISSKSYLAKQEMYDYSIKEISDMLMNENSHIDGRMFVSIFEEIFKVNIYIIDGNGVVPPRHSHGYFKRPNDYPSVIIYEHLNELKTVTGELLSRYELVSLTKGKKRRNLLFEKNSKISQTLNSELKNKLNYYINDKPLDIYRDIRLPENWSIINQMFDSYGKARVILIENSITYNKVKLQIEPMQPFDAPDFNSNEFSEMDLENSSIINEYNDTDEIITDETSLLCILLKSERLGRIMEEYIIWLFQKYKYPKTYEGIMSFITEKTVIIPEYEYKNVLKIFTEEQGIMKNGKIVLNHPSLQRNVKYILYITIKRNPGKYEKYEKIKFIPSYYKNIWDFRDNFSKSDCDQTDYDSFHYTLQMGDVKI